MISCPKCKGTEFKTGLDMCKRANVDLEDGHIKVYPIDNERNSSLIQCIGCGESYQINDPKILHMLTHPLVKCVECGREFTEEELDENNICEICRLKKVDEAFANFENADSFTLMRALAHVRMENLELSNKNESVQKDLQRAEEIHEEEVQEQPKPKRKRRTKAEMEAVRAEEASQEETVEIDGESKEESDIEISEDIAPDLPEEVTDMSKAMNPPVED